MDFDDYLVPALSNEDLERTAAQWREPLNRFFVTNSLDVVALYRAANALLKRPVDLVIQPDSAMGRANAYVSHDRKKLFVRQSLVDGASAGDQSSIFDAVHELGHVVLHPAGSPLARMLDGNIKQRHIPERESAEHHANFFARAFLMSLDEVRRFPSAEDLSNECYVPLGHAKRRLEEAARLPKSLRPNTPNTEPSNVRWRTSPGASRRVTPTILPVEIGKRVAWETAEPIEELDISEFRLFEGRWTIRWSRFGVGGPGGWTLDHTGTAVPWEKERLT